MSDVQKEFREFLKRHHDLVKDLPIAHVAIIWHDGVESGIHVSHQRRMEGMQKKYGSLAAPR